MRKVLYGFLATLLLAACHKKEETAEVTRPAAAGEVETAPAAPASSPVQPAPVAEVRLNPPHGESGHLCEIAVGAPLPAQGVLPAPVETAPARPMPIDPGATSIISQPLNTVVFNGPKPQFNPPHGEPWHTCDLEVGAPLK
ncbi:hypothetical protein [Leadbetterella sp. DM7]|uniref:hypothetical protein n=1 Tax=Leadbetterella sp. DM7 TaxID=3235085 RepID=UPI00349EC844